MDIPSFWFAAIDPETRELAQELRELGGGDASDFNIQVHCFVNSSREKKETQLIWPYERSIGIKDAQLAMTHPSNEAVKYYTVTCAYDLHKVLNNFDEYPHTSDLVDSVISGFNLCLITLGERGSGKSSLIFGSPFRNPGAGGVLRSIVHDLFEKRKIKQNYFTVGLSVWILQGQTIIDLLAPKSRGTLPMEFSLVECPSEDITIKLIALARRRAFAGGGREEELGSLGPDDSCLDESLRGHLFMRIVLHRQDPTDIPGIGVLSHIHIVDTIGTGATLHGREFNALSETDKISRREISTQLHSLSKILSEMKSTSPSSSSGGGAASCVRLTSARDSKLSSILPPIIQGNCRTVLLAVVKDGESHNSMSKSTLSHVEGVTNIVSGVHIVKGVSLHSLRMLQCHDHCPADPHRNTNTDHYPADPHCNTNSVDLLNSVDGNQQPSPSHVSIEKNFTSLPFKAKTTRAESIGRVDSSQIETIMGEFHDLMAEMQSQQHLGELNSNRYSFDDFRANNGFNVSLIGVESNRAIEGNNSSSNGKYDIISHRSHPIDKVETDDLTENSDGSAEIVVNALEAIREGRPKFEVDFIEAEIEEIVAKNVRVVADRVDSLIRDHQPIRRNRDWESNHQWLPREMTSSPSLPIGFSQDNSNGIVTSASAERNVDLKESRLAEIEFNGIGSGLPRRADCLDDAALPTPATLKQHRYSEVAGESKSREEDGAEPRHFFTKEISPSTERDSLELSNVCVMEALAEERLVRQNAEAELISSREEVLELRTQYEIEIEGYKVEALRMRSQIRSLCSDNSLSDVLASFEENAARLVKENASLRSRNLFLEERDMSSSLRKSLNRQSFDDIKSYRDDGYNVPDRSNLSQEFSLVESVLDSKSSKLLSRLKRVMHEKDELRQQLEGLLRKERLHQSIARLTEETKKKLKLSYQENQVLQNEVSSLKEALSSATRDNSLILEELRSIQSSEHQLREERSRTISETKLLRERVRELDAERKRVAQLNRFISKHSHMTEDDGKEGTACKVATNHTTLNSNRGIGLAGLPEAQYARSEEDDVNSPTLDAALSRMHAGIIDFCPKLLPSFRTLSAEIHLERTKSLQHRSHILGLLCANRPQSEKKSQSRSSMPFNPQAVPSHITNLGSRSPKKSVLGGYGVSFGSK